MEDLQMLCSDLFLKMPGSTISKNCKSCAIHFLFSYPCIMVLLVPRNQMTWLDLSRFFVGTQIFAGNFQIPYCYDASNKVRVPNHTVFIQASCLPQLPVHCNIQSALVHVTASSCKLLVTPGHFLPHLANSW